MSIIDTSFFVGICPFRQIPSSIDDLQTLRKRAGIDRAAATGFRSMFYYDPMDALTRDLSEFGALKAWLRFWAVVNPEFPQIASQVSIAAGDDRVVGIRLFPTLHHFKLTSDPCLEATRMAAEKGLPVNVTARLFDNRVAPKMVNQAEVDREDLISFIEQASGATVILSMFFFNELQALKVDWKNRSHVYVDLGCSKPNAASLDALGSGFPLDRVIYGTGAPLYYWGGSRLELEGCRLDDQVKKAVLGGTAKEVLRWA